MTQYRPVPPQVDLPAMEHAILDLWQARGIFAKQLDAKKP